MKRHLTVLAVSALLIGGTNLCQASVGSGHPAPPRCEEPPSREPLPAELARIPDLSEVQKGQIRAILSAERDKGQAQRQKEHELRQQLLLAERAAAFNEQALRSAAAALAGLETEALVARAKLHYRIYTVLNASQRAWAEKLLPEQGGRPAPPCDCEHEEWHPRGPAGEHEGRPPQEPAGEPGWR